MLRDEEETVVSFDRDDAIITKFLEMLIRFEDCRKQGLGNDVEDLR